MNNYTHLTIFTDGASRGNPGLAAIGVHIVDGRDGSTVEELSETIGHATNNVAEYRAFLSAVSWLLARRALLSGDILIDFRMDSELLVKHLRREYKVSDAKLKPLYASVTEGLQALPGTHTFEHIPRSENKHADRLANEALDNQSRLS
jgi:ribonuclease HI